MEDLGIPISNIGKLLGTLGGSVAVMAYLMRKFLLSDKVASAAANAATASAQGNVDIIAALHQLVDRAEKREKQADERAALAEKRADDAYKERNEAYREIGALREQVKYLTETVESLKRQLDHAAT